MMFSDRVAAHKDTIIAVHNDHFQFSELMKLGHIELSKAAVTAVAIVIPHVKKCVMTPIIFLKVIPVAIGFELRDVQNFL